MASGQSEQLTAVRGFRDLLPSEAEATSALEITARACLGRYGFREIRLPTLEQRELFIKATGETTDIVEKEMFQLEDQGGRHLALRPEGTPGVVRAYINNNLKQQGGITRLFYIGSMFRAERPQAGRFREFEQIGAECLGNPHPAADVEAILSLNSIFNAVGLGGKTHLRINNIGCDQNSECRPKYRDQLREFLQMHINELCENCKRRIVRNPLRALDCKRDAPKLSDAPRLEPCSECMDHHTTVAAMLTQNGFDGLAPDVTLVRGLDYYTRTVFEFQAKGIGSQDAIAGGGRYDGLVASMGGEDTPAVGWAMGVERTLAAVSLVTGNKSLQDQRSNKPDVFVTIQDFRDEGLRREASAKGVRIMENLRKEGLRVEGGMFGSGNKAQMREASRKQAHLALVINEPDLSLTLKDMATPRQWPVTDESSVVSAVKAGLNGEI